MNSFPTLRLTRLRHHPILRQLIHEAHLSVKDLILPLFVKEGSTKKEAIDLMPGHFQLTLEDLTREIEEIKNLGISGIILFGIPTHKDPTGSTSYQKNNIVAQAIRLIKTSAPDLLVMTDVCLCGYTNHGHCGILNSTKEESDIDNDATLEILSKQAISHAKAGADVVAPSAMMDGMVSAIRSGLDNAGFINVPILSYSVKYASSFYAPFREAAESAPNKGDRRSYQMDPSNALEALREVKLDLQEGADMIMVKPAGPYLDVIYRVKKAYPDIPLGAYQVSGEFSMIRAAAMNGWIEESRVVLESLLAIKRAGANFIITYFAKNVATWLNENK